MTSESAALLTLPVEMIVSIFRYLDSKSLLNAAVSHKRFSEICKDDVVLRNRIGTHILTERERDRTMVLYARMYLGLYPSWCSALGKHRKGKGHAELERPEGSGLDDRRRGRWRSLSAKTSAEPYNKNIRC